MPHSAGSAAASSQPKLRKCARSPLPSESAWEHFRALHRARPPAEAAATPAATASASNGHLSLSRPSAVRTPRALVGPAAACAWPLCVAGTTPEAPAHPLLHTPLRQVLLTREPPIAEAFALPPAVNCFDAKIIDALRPDTAPVTKLHVFGTKPGSTEWLAPARPCSRDAPRPHAAPRRASSARRKPPPRRRCRHREPVWPRQPVARGGRASRCRQHRAAGAPPGWPPARATRRQGWPLCAHCGGGAGAVVRPSGLWLRGWPSAKPPNGSTLCFKARAARELARHRAGLLYCARRQPHDDWPATGRAAHRTRDRNGPTGALSGTAARARRPR